MGNKKKRGRPDLEELLARPWCYYCERDFDDLKILIDHQRAKHFKCDRCGRRLNTAGGLSVHLNQVHKETLQSIENALPNRSNPDVEIFGTTGIPEDVADAHRQRVLTQFAQAEAERRAATGNTASGTSGGENAAKKPKVESKEDIKKRMAEFKAKKAAAAQQGASSVSSPATPGPTDQSQQSLPAHTAPGMPSQQAYGSFPQPYGAPVGGFPPAQSSFSPAQTMAGFTSPPSMPYAQSFQAPQPYGQPMSGGYGHPGQAPGQFLGAPVPGGFPGQPPRPYGAQSPPMPYGQQGQSHLPSISTPPGGVAPFAAGQGTNGQAMPPGLPQRPASGAPPPGLQHPLPGQPPQQHPYAIKQNGSATNSTVPTPGPQGSVPQEAQQASTPQPKPDTASALKKSKKDDKIRMVYSDNETSPEEKMASLTRYAYQRDTTQKTVLETMGQDDGAGVTSAGFNDYEHGPRNLS